MLTVVVLVPLENDVHLELQEERLQRDGARAAGRVVRRLVAVTGEDGVVHDGKEPGEGGAVHGGERRRQPGVLRRAYGEVIFAVD